MRVEKAVILAGGRSSRMGKDKALLPFGDYSSLSEFQYRKLERIFERVYISSKIAKFDFTANLIVEESQIYSPLVALKQILEELQEPVFILAVDMPFISKLEISRLREGFSSRFDARVALHSHLEPLSGVYHPKILRNIDEMLSKDNHKLNYLLKVSKVEKIEFQDSRAFRNLNYEEDYREALSILNSPL